MKRIKIFEAFAGYGSQYLGLKRVYGESCISVGISEVDADVIISNAIIHHYEQFQRLMGEAWDEKRMTVAREWLRSRNIAFDFVKGKSKLDRMKKDKLKQLAIASKLTRNYGDISICNGTKLSSEIDLFTYSSPCQSFSIAGKLEGLKGTSGLLLECEKFIRINKPKVLMLENVKNLIGKQFKGDFDNWCNILTGLGYKNYWKVLNAKDYTIPQNRERVFLVSTLNSKENYEFPQKQKLNQRLKDILEDTVDEKYYLKSSKAQQLIDDLAKRFRIGESEGCDMSLKNPKIRDVANCIMARYDSGVTNNQAEGTAVIERIGDLMEGTSTFENRGAGRKHLPIGLCPTIISRQAGGHLGGDILESIICEQRSDEGLRFFKGNICGALRTTNSCGDKVVLEPIVIDSEDSFVEKRIKEFYNAKGYYPELFNPYNKSDLTKDGLAPTQTTTARSLTGSACVLVAEVGKGIPVEPQVLKYQRTEFGRKIRKEYEIMPTQFRRDDMREIVPRQDGVSNTLTTVLKDNYVIEPRLESLGEVENPSWVKNGNELSRECKEEYPVYGVGGVACTQRAESRGLDGRTRLYFDTPSYRIRKLTPKECFRLMGVDDVCSNRLVCFQSNSSLYKQAGNSIVVNVVEAIFEKLKDCNIL